MVRNGFDEGASTPRRSVSDSRFDVPPRFQIRAGRLFMLPYTIRRAAGMSSPDLGQPASTEMGGPPSTGFLGPIVWLESPRAVE